MRSVSAITIREIESPGDPAWPQWMDIYYESFPENERMTDGHFVRFFQQKAAGNCGDSHLLVLSADPSPDDVIGMAYYEVNARLRIGLLWYLATRRDQRDRGYGAAFYADLLRRTREAGADAVLFEVEKPEIAEEEGQEQAALARRRIAWYQRQGAHLLRGVQYFQSVDAPVPPLEMDLMVQSFAPMSAAEVFAKASRIFGDSITRTGELSLR